MNKYYCDKCGKEIGESKGFLRIEHVDEVSIIGRSSLYPDLCEEHYKELIDIIYKFLDIEKKKHGKNKK